MKRTGANERASNRQAVDRIVVRNAQRKIGIDAARFSEFAAKAWAACDSLRATAWPGSPILVVIVSDRRMSALHQKFMSVRGPTDVITFQHGEIVISAETARRQAREFGTSLRHELQLYLVHGLLHLRGFDDRRPPDAKRMSRLQEQILREVESKRAAR